MEVWSSLQVRSSLWVLGVEGKKERNAWCRCKLRQRSSQGKRNVRKFVGLHLLYSSRIWVRVFFFLCWSWYGILWEAEWELKIGSRQSEAGRLTEIMYWSLTKCSGMGYTKRWKYFSDEKWKQKPNGWVLENWGILSDEWRKLNEKLWVIKKNNPNRALLTNVIL